ncbi:MAG TPA: helix-turn-helix transcriptional regulator [Candidatus Saccharimonadales bacterium]|nr:helix-turn-helix transcriptional regulator [Candidatus Saccharimonadales bacterium]
MDYPRIYKEYKPSKHLRHVIRCYWQYERDCGAGEAEQVFPDSSYELFYNRGATHVVDGEKLPRFYLVNQLEKPTNFYATGTVKAWSIRFYPWGLLPFTANNLIPSDKIWFPARDILDATTHQSLERILSRANETQIIAELDAFLVKKLLTWEFDDRTLKRVLDHLIAEKKNISVQALADACFISRRHLTRKITAATGRSPHELAMRLRFEKVRDTIMHHPDVSLTQLAQDYNYTDQSHLIKEFRRFTDMTPSSYAKKFKVWAPQLQNSENVLFVQFDALPYV